jgi:hypothetical protein
MILLWACCLVQDADPEGVRFYENRIRPMLVERCLRCHGGGPKSPKGNLRVDTREALVKGGEQGPAIVPQDPDKSLLLRAVRYADPELRMPPPSEKARLSTEQIADLEAWIRRGAPAPRAAPPSAAADVAWESRKTWVFSPPVDPAVPAVGAAPWTGNPVDAFIRSKLEAQGLAPAPPADKRTLLRRASVDLIGLPPTTEELAAFLADERPDAFARVVDRLLASRQYGERWARYWLDLARYAVVREDIAAKGNQPSEIPEAWRYRDWVIDAFNRDLPFNEFVVRQIAGDLLPDGDVVASGFLAIGEWGIQDDNPEKMVWDTADEQIDALGRTFLGLTLACARCHDHKFDPLTSRDYYGLAGIFTSTHVVAAPAKIGVHTPMVRIPIGSKADVESHQARTAEITARIAEAEKRRVDSYRNADATERGDEKDARLLSPDVQEALAAIRAELQALRKSLPPPLPVAVGAQEGGIPGTSYAGIHNAKIRIRGDYLRLGAEVPRSFPAVFARKDQPIAFAGSGRLELARWLASPSHPLTARVLVNRLWQHHFGYGIVRTPSNFGRLGEAPTHPELLDWLAHRFVQGGWSIKAMHRLLMLSNAYQQSSAGGPGSLERDPENRLFGRMTRRRAEAEVVRDSLLEVTGALDRAGGGPSVADPYSRRRMIYLTVSRTSRSPFEALFDGADPTAHTDRRTISTVAPQALFLMNHRFISDAAAALAKRLQAEEPSDPRARIARAYALLYSRPPAAEEVELGLDFIRRSGSEAAGWKDYARVLLCANEFVTVD